MLSTHQLRVAARAGAGMLAGAVIGLAQWQIISAGMRASDRAPGLEGIGAAVAYGAAVTVVSIALLTGVAAVLRLRYWGVAGIGLFVAEMVVVAVLWGSLPLHGTARLAYFVVVLGLELGVASLRYRAPDR